MEINQDKPKTEIYTKKEILSLGRRDLMRQTWRPIMAFAYAVICLADFVLFPILWSLLQVLHNGDVLVQWRPITLEGAGLIHLSFGSILGVAAWSRNLDKKNGAD